MVVPSEIATRIATLSGRLGCPLNAVRCWKSDFDRPVLYCNFRGILHESSEMKIEVAGTLCAELASDHDDEIDLFLFLNGQRVGLYKEPSEYLIGRGQSPFRWGRSDAGFDRFKVLDSTTFSAPIAESLRFDPSNEGG